MPHKIYLLNTEKKEKLDLNWEGSYRNFTAKLDNIELGAFKSKKELKEGREFKIGYDKKLKIQLIKESVIFPCIEILMNNTPVPGTMTDPRKQLTDIFYFVLFIAALNILFGLTGTIFDIKVFNDHGIGLNSIIYGALFLMIGLLINKRQSVFALIAVISLLVLDIVFIIAHAAEYGVQSNPWSTIAIKIFFILYLSRGFSSIKRYRQFELLKIEQERIEQEKRQKIPKSQQRTEDHKSFMPKDHSKYLPDE